MRATDFVDEPADGEELQVDFTHVATVYLSSYMINKSGFVGMDHFREGPQVLISFFNYLITHDVCPEYAGDVQGALAVANQAKIELPRCKQLAQGLPDILNRACSLLYGGELYGMFDDCWGGEEKVAKMIGISMKEAMDRVSEIFGREAVEGSDIRRIHTEDQQAQIVHIEEPQIDATEPAKRLYSQIVVRKCESKDRSNMTIYIRPEVARHAMVGMLITADFHELSNGWRYWDRVTNVYPSYFMAEEEDCDD